MSRFNPARRLRRRASADTHKGPERAPWHREFHPWTIEGRIEDIGRIARGLKSPRMRNPFVPFMLKFVGVTFLLVIGAAVIVEIIRRVF